MTFENVIGPDPDPTAPSWPERVSARALGAPLTALLGVVVAAQVITWAPNYLTWPWWADHDVFATAAFAWHRGVLPYRDLLGNNFPATTYLFYVLGRLCGWGYTPAFWAVDVGFVLALGAVLIGWSRRRFGRSLPGLVGYLTFLGYYLNLDYSQAAQRDWHAPFFAILATLVPQAWPGRGGRIVSALAFATALAFRPQVVLFLPAIGLALDESERIPGEGFGATSLALAEWGLIAALAAASWFLPLWASGIWDDFLEGLRVASYGGRYNQVTIGSFGRAMLIQLLNLKVGLTGAAIALLIGRAGPRTRRLAWTWVVALVGVLLYRPLSPNPLHPYLTHPITATWAVAMAVLTGLVLEAGLPLPSIRLAVVLLVIGMGASPKPRFCNPVGSLEALSCLRRGADPEPAPTGYTTNPESHSAGYYEWDDYRKLLDYLRHQTAPDMLVANALRNVPAVTGPAARLPAFPAESVAWLRVVNVADEPKFVESLERAEDSIVVWDPHRPDKRDFETLPRLEAAIERLYEPDLKFGIIEVWRRRAAK